MRRHIEHTIFLIICALIVAVQLWRLSFSAVEKTSVHENRKLSKFPGLSLNSPASFPTGFDAWFNDHFPFRNTLLNFRMDLDVYVFRQSPIPKFVIIGQNFWLYNTGHEIEVYRGINRFSEEELRRMSDSVKSRKAFIEKQGAIMLYAIAPVKYSVYPEFLPANLRRVNAESRTDQFVKYMTSAGLPVIDLRKTLIRAKNDTFPLFYKSDNHWNLNGAFAAYHEIMKNILGSMPSAGPVLERKDYNVKVSPRLHGNLSDMLYMNGECNDHDYLYRRICPGKTHVDTNKKYVVPSYFRSKENYEVRYSNGNPHSPKILIIRDSFGHNLAQFLKENFSETVCIFDAWEYKLNPDIIKKEKPDIVLFLVLESFTDTLLK